MGGEAPVGFGGLGGQGETGEQVGAVGLGVDPGAVAVADQGVAGSGTVAAFGVADKEPVFLADGGGPVEAPGRGRDSQLPSCPKGKGAGGD